MDEVEHAVQDADRDGDLGGPPVLGPDPQAVPMTRFQRLKNASTKARTLYQEDFCQGMHPYSAMCWRCRSRGVGSVSAVALGTAVDRGGTTTAASGVCPATSAVTPVRL